MAHSHQKGTFSHQSHPVYRRPPSSSDVTAFGRSAIAWNDCLHSQKPVSSLAPSLRDYPLRHRVEVDLIRRSRRAKRWGRQMPREGANPKRPTIPGVHRYVRCPHFPRRPPRAGCSSIHRLPRRCPERKSACKRRDPAQDVPNTHTKARPPMPEPCVTPPPAHSSQQCQCRDVLESSGPFPSPSNQKSTLRGLASAGYPPLGIGHAPEYPSGSSSPSFDTTSSYKPRFCSNAARDTTSPGVWVSRHSDQSFPCSPNNSRLRTKSLGSLLHKFAASFGVGVVNEAFGTQPDVNRLRYEGRRTLAAL